MSVTYDINKQARYSIATFFTGRSVFVTGGVGFLGKVLIEKLLRSCPEIREIYLLIRPKKGNSAEERLKKAIELPLFDKLREQDPSIFAKLIPLNGDCSVERLGLSPEDRQTLVDRVSVIFHAAANVRFHQNLQLDVFSNVRSTRDICELGLEMKNMVALIHVSTAYSQCDKPVVDEVVYPPVADWKNVIEIAENLDQKLIATFSIKCLGNMPNTYTFSKRLAEQVIIDYSKRLPCVIVRPSIVVSSFDDPISGWIDNFNGPMGLMVGGGKGILRVVLMDPVVASDYIPVDVTIKATLIATWKRGLVTVEKDPEVHVYNCTSHNICSVAGRELIAIGLRSNEKLPVDGVLWYPRTTMTSSRFVYYILTLLLQLLPSLVIDSILKMTGQKPILVGIHKQIYAASLQLEHFTTNQWYFRNEKVIDLLTNQVPPNEKNDFGFDFQVLDLTKFFSTCLLGAKRYLLHDDLSRIEDNKRRLERLLWLDRIVDAIMIAMAARFLWNIGFVSGVLGLIGA
nr:putative fatty acyl-CoA reductase CG5065 [Megalopta genalis]